MRKDSYFSTIYCHIFLAQLVPPLQETNQPKMDRYIDGH